MDSHVVQVTNVAPGTTDEQIHTLFNFLGPIEEYAVYPKFQDPGNAGTKVAFIKFTEGASVGIAQHLTNTVFIDRPLICVPYNEGLIPDEMVAMQFVGPANAVAGMAGMQAGSMDPSKLDEIRRTIYIGNLDSKTATAEQLMSFFSSCGEVKFVRMAGDETQPTRFAFVEFADVDNVQQAMQLNGSLFGDRPLKINHSNNAIVKPTGKTPDTSSNREIDEAMRRVREAQTLISLALEPEPKPGKRPRSRSRSRHRRRRSRSRDRSRRRRSRSKSHGRSRRSRSRDRSRRSRRSRSRSKERRRKRSRSRSPRKKSSSRSPSKKSSKSHKSKDRKRDKDHKHSSSGRHGDRSKKDEKNGESKTKSVDDTEKKQNGKVEVES